MGNLKFKLFTHTDLDGVGCAILAFLAFGRENVDVEYCDYGDIDGKVREFWDNGSVEEYDKVFITDISLSEDLAGDIDFDNVDEKCLLFDHHATAIWMNRYEWCQVLINDPALDIKTSGTEMFYHYLQQHEQFEPYDGLGADVFQNIWRFVDIVRDYDTWRWKEIGGEEGDICKQVNDLFYIYGRDKFIKWALHQIRICHKPRKVYYTAEAFENAQALSVLEGERDSFPWFSGMDRTLLEQKQKDIDIYIEQKNKQMAVKIDSFGYQYGVVFAERYFSELGNRLCDMNPEIDYIAMVDICEGKVHYRTIREDVDLGREIAHNYGGGGHKKAARSTFNGKAAMAELSDYVFIKSSDGLMFRDGDNLCF